MKLKQAVCLPLSLLFLLNAFLLVGSAQSDYAASVQRFRDRRAEEFRDPNRTPFFKYKDLKNFKGLKWYAVDPAYKVVAVFRRDPNAQKFEMPTFGNTQTMTHARYGTLKFSLNGNEYTLAVYQNSEFAATAAGKNYLFVPFRDQTNEDETYTGGRYIDFSIPNSDTVTLDFNLAYNPHCAYESGNICPVPPAENRMNTRVEAGEKIFDRKPAKAVKSEKPKESEKAAKVEKPKEMEKAAKVEKPKEPKEAPAKTDSVAIPAKGKFANFDGSKVYYTSRGKGKEALVFIHGWTCNSDFWRGQVGGFADKRVIAIDLPGHGRSDKPQVDYSMEYFARGIEAVLRDAGVGKAVLAGHSMGTPVIRQFYRLYPQKTLGLVIVDGALRPFAPRPVVENFFAPMFADYQKHAPGFVEGMLQPINDEALKQEIRTGMSATPAHVGISAMRGMLDDAIWKEDKISVPTLAILAENPNWQPDTESYYKQIAPNMDFRMWKNVSHFLMMEKPQEFNQALKFYLNKNKLLQN
jgi:hypothetical protein